MWWKDSVIYQIYIRSFRDSNGDGIGDINGVTSKLPYLKDLGIKGIWLSPTSRSANYDWGYDVIDYLNVDPELGTNKDLERLIQAAKELDIKIVLDLVPNHTSIYHPWFKMARSSKDNLYRDYYIWADPRLGRRPPNNWRSSFGGSAWQYDKTTAQFYLHNFLKQQADLNWLNPLVQEEFKKIIRYWFDRGVSGFRIDVVNMLVKDKLLRDNPKPKSNDSFYTKLLNQESKNSGNGKSVHQILRDWRDIADGYREKRLLLGETMVYKTTEIASFYGDNDELDLGFNFIFWQSKFKAKNFKKIVHDIEADLPNGGWPVWAASNHDISRAASRWAHGDDRRSRLINMLLLTLRGTPVIYYGEELGMTDHWVHRYQYQDVVGKSFWPLFNGRDRERTPMVWDKSKGGGFSSSSKAKPWLPLGSNKRNVADQQKTYNSNLNFTKRLIAFRNSNKDLNSGIYKRLHVQDHNLMIYHRGISLLVALNISPRTRKFRAPFSKKIISTYGPQSFDSKIESDSWILAPWEGIILRIV